MWRALSAEQSTTIRAARDKDLEIKKKSLRGKSLYWTGGIVRSRTSYKEAEDHDDSDDDDTNANASAGDAFGGREEKNQAKKRIKK
jgi:hypothetical protein